MSEGGYETRGPAVGDAFPDVRLPDQHEREVDLHAARAGRRAVVAFQRSAVWWPYCKTQLVELQRVRPELERAGYAVFAITYDRPPDLAAFAAAHGITYPLLSDEGSRTIRALGILDQDLEAHHAVFGVPTRPEQQGVAYPMTFVLDERGRVARKLVEANYRLRYGGGWLVEQLLGTPIERGPRLEATRTGGRSIVSARAWLDAPAYFAYQRLGLHLELAVAPGWHVYAPDPPPGYTGLRLDVRSAPDGVRLGPIDWPQARPFRVAGLDETFAVLEGPIAISAPLEFTVPRNSGAVRLEIGLAFQACSERECLPPDAVAIAIDVPEAPAP